MNEFEALLSGGHPNSLGRALDVVDAVLADRSRLQELYRCWLRSDDELAAWLRPHANRLADDDRKSVAANARKLIAQFAAR